MMVDKENSEKGKKHQDSSSVGPIQEAGAREDQVGWALKVYQDRKEEDLLREVEENILELDLEDEEEEMSRKHLTMAIYYSCKSFNPKLLFVDMLRTWGIQSLTLVERVGDYIFKLEFHKPEEKKRVLEGAPWRHKGDALIVTHYDGCTRPSEVHITSIALWIRLYDLPQTMMKESFARQLEGQWGDISRRIHDT
jgi:hypothetical protein